MSILNGVHTLQLRSNDEINNGEKEYNERVPNEEDEIVPNFELKSLISNNIHDSDCQCQECQINSDIKKENLIVQKNIKDLETKITCVICLTNTRNIIFGPCNHLATCISCSKNPSLKKCPLCRKVFDTKTRVFC